MQRGCLATEQAGIQRCRHQQGGKPPAAAGLLARASPHCCPPPGRTAQWLPTAALGCCRRQ
jgi:hypothetical protein